MIEQTGYALDLLRESADFTLYRGRELASQLRVLVVALADEQPSAQSQRRLEHEYSLAGEIDAAWAAKPIALTRHHGRTVLILKDPGGEPLSRALDQGRGQALDLTRALRIGIGLAAAVGQVHRQSLIHKDLKPENVFLDDAGRVWLTGFGIASRLARERQPPAPLLRDLVPGRISAIQG